MTMQKQIGSSHQHVAIVCLAPLCAQKAALAAPALLPDRLFSVVKFHPHILSEAGLLLLCSLNTHT